MVKIKINGKTFKAPEKSTIIQVADENGIEIPSVDLNLARKITKFLKDNMDEEIDSTSYEVNYSPKYYDLI